MKLTYDLAALSYCPDLTDPNARSVVIAVLAVGRVADGQKDKVWLAAMAGIDATRLGLDPLSAAMLSDVPHLLREHVDEAIRRLGAKAVGRRLLSDLYEQLKTSIHVSEIASGVPLDVADASAASTRLMDIALESLVESTTKKFEMPGTRWTPRESPETLMEVPERAVWSPRVSQELSAA